LYDEQGDLIALSCESFAVRALLALSFQKAFFYFTPPIVSPLAGPPGPLFSLRLPLDTPPLATSSQQFSHTTPLLRLLFLLSLSLGFFLPRPLLPFPLPRFHPSPFLFTAIKPVP
ncbi:AhpA/YtjB family protein, partial [Escherichia coli]|uniref:AhpA/YtjB family protein n=1 Tax=Escherichia coli TaxID=562 RepID=UPI0029D78E1E